MIGPGEAVLDAVGSAKSPEGIRGPVAARLSGVGELDTIVVREDRVGAVGDGLDKRFEGCDRGVRVVALL